MSFASDSQDDPANQIDPDGGEDEEWLAAHRAGDPSYVPGQITIAVTLDPDLAARFPTPESVIAALRSVPKKRTLGIDRGRIWISPDFDAPDQEAAAAGNLSEAEMLRLQAQMIADLQREHGPISDEDLAEVEKQWSDDQHITSDMKLDEIVLIDGRRLLDIWPDAVKKVEEGDHVRFISFPDNRTGKVFTEDGRRISLYAFEPSGDTRFVESRIAWPEPVAE